MKVERPPSVTAASALSILYGIVGVSWGLCGLLGMLFHDAAGGNQIPSYQIVHVSAIGLELISAVALLIAGIGLLSLNRWARLLTIVFATIGIAAFSFQAAYQVVYVLPTVNDALAAAPLRPGAPFDPMARWFRSIRADFAIGALVFFVLEIVNLAIVLIMLLRASARRAFDHDSQLPPEYDAERVLLRSFGLVLVLFCAGSTPAQDKGGFFPVKAIVIGKSDVANEKSVLATILVGIPAKQRFASDGWFEKADTIHLEITARTKIEKLVSGKRTEAKIDEMVKGCKIEFRDYAEVLLSRPAIVSPRTVIITDPEP